MKLKSKYIKGFMDFLMSLELAGKQSRMRTRFCKLLDEKMVQMENERFELIQQFGKKDEIGELLQSEDDKGNKVYQIDDIPNFTKELNILMNEDFYIDETMERKEMLMTIKDLVLDCELTFKGEDAIAYDIWCEAVEEIKYSDN